MDDEKFKELFDSFQPELSSDNDFMSKLQDSLDKVEIIRQHNSELQRRSKKIGFAAAIAGFVTGVLFTLLLPSIDNLVKTIGLLEPQIGLNVSLLSYGFLYWIIGAFFSLASALTVYDVLRTK